MLAYFFTAATTANSVRLFNFYRIPNRAIIHTFDNPLICGLFPEGTSCHELRMTSTPICQRPGRDTKKIGQFWIARRIVGAEPTGYFCVLFPVQSWLWHWLFRWLSGSHEDVRWVRLAPLASYGQRAKVLPVFLAKVSRRFLSAGRQQGTSGTIGTLSPLSLWTGRDTPLRGVPVRPGVPWAEG
jgi:hypothetical protein